MKQAAGTLLFRRHEGQLEVLIVHPSGAYNLNKAWSIPKGELEEGETHQEAARRETLEETGVTAGELVPIGFVTYRKSRKRVYAFAGKRARGTPHCASWEVDWALFVPIDKARQLLHVDQRPFLDRLEKLLDAGKSSRRRGRGGK